MKRLLFFLIVPIYLASACLPGPGNIPRLIDNQSQSNPSSSSGGPKPKLHGDIPDCPVEIDEPLFNHSPLALGDFDSIVPLGNLAPPSHTFPTNHLYFQLRRSEPGNYRSLTADVPVYSPGRIWITSVSSSEHLSASVPYIDYSLRFSPCRQFQGYYIHVQSLNETLLEQIGKFNENNCNTYETGGDTYRNCSKYDLSIVVQSGDIIGRAGGQEGQSALDFGAYDTRVPPLQYANPSVYQPHPKGFGFMQIVCAIDYYSDDLRSDLLSRFGGWGNEVRTSEPICGEVEQDEPGTAQGKWYLKGAKIPFPEDPHIALVHDNVNPQIGAFSIGNSLPDLESGIYYFQPENEDLINRDFNQVRPNGNLYCYESLSSIGDNPSNPLQKIILVQLTSEIVIRIEARNATECGEVPWDFGDGTVEYIR